jgi:hypothetical protein
MIFTSLEVQIEGLRIFFKHQNQRNKGKNMKRKKRTFVIFCFNCFEEKTLTFFIFKPHIYFILNPF